MLYHYFNLDQYFKQTRQYFIFIDGLFKMQAVTKKEVLDKLKIPESTYRTNRAKLRAKYKWSYLPILEYFGYKDVDSKDQRKYELLLAKIYHNAYYKDINALHKLLIELNEIIDESNYLKPIFVLFRILINYITISKYSEQFESSKEDLEYLKYFYRDFLTEEFVSIYQMFRFYFGKYVSNVELENYAVKYPKLLWLYYILRGSYHYLHNRGEEALTYYELLLDIFWKDFNLERFSITSSNVAFIYNHIDKYSLSLERSSKLVSYAIANEDARTHSKYAVKHFIFSLYMLDKFDEVVEVMEILNDLSYLGDIYIAIFMIIHKINHTVYDLKIKERISNNSNLIEIGEMLTARKLNVEKVKEMYKTLPYWSKIVEKMQVDVLRF